MFLVLALLLSLLVLPAQAAEEAIGVTINGTPVTYDDGYGRPFVDAAGRTQVPFRLTMETFGCTVDWDNDTRTAVAEKDGTKVEVPVGRDYLIINGKRADIDTTAQLVDGRVYLPIRPVLEAFDASVTWNSKDHLVVVTTGSSLVRVYFLDVGQGDATLIDCGETEVLIDGGTNSAGKDVVAAIAPYIDGKLDYVIATHPDADHVGGLATLSKKSAAPVYVTRGVSHILTCPVVAFTAGDTLEFAGCTVRSFSTSHDAVDPVGYRVDAADGSLGILTDTGFVTDAARESLAGVDTLLLEANHDVETLQYGPYPYFLKRRILGDEGHLSNDAAAEFARLAVQSGTRDILLAHLSKENNTPELAEYAVARALQSAGLSVRLGVAPRDTMSEVHLCRRSPSFASAN